MRALFLSAAVAEEWPLGVESAWPAGEWMMRPSASSAQDEARAEVDARQAGLPAPAQPAANDA